MNDEISANPSKTNVYTNFTVLTKAPIIVPGAGLDLLHLITFWQSPLSTLHSPLSTRLSKVTLWKMYLVVLHRLAQWCLSVLNTL